MNINKLQAKAIIICISVILMICSILSIVSFIYVMTVYHPHHRSVPQNIKEDLTGLPGRSFKAICFFGVSTLIMANSIFGIYAVSTESSVLLTAHWIALMVLFMLAVMRPVVSAASAVSLSRHVRDQLKIYLKEYDKNRDMRTVIDEVQREYECCGIDSYEDWIVFAKHIPPSCCGRNATSCEVDDAKETAGCLRLITEKKINVGIALLGIATFETFIVLLALIVVSKLQHSAIADEEPVEEVPVRTN